MNKFVYYLHNNHATYNLQFFIKGELVPSELEQGKLHFCVLNYIECFCRRTRIRFEVYYGDNNDNKIIPFLTEVLFANLKSFLCLFYAVFK